MANKRTKITFVDSINVKKKVEPEIVFTEKTHTINDVVEARQKKGTKSDYVDPFDQYYATHGNPVTKQEPAKPKPRVPNDDLEFIKKVNKIFE